MLTRSVARAARILRGGGLVAFPTETVYGLGAPAFDAPAIRGIFRAKGRPADNPLIAHIASTDQIPLLASRIPASAARLIDRFFPGPLTVILPRHPAVPREATAGLDTIGVRMPDHPVTRAFLRACGTPLVAPSANRSGRPSPTGWQAVAADLHGRIACILRGKAAAIGLESTVVDCTGRVPVVLRAGAVTLEDLRRVIPATRMASKTETSGERPRSPGMRHRHYAPRAMVIVTDDPRAVLPSPRHACIGIRPTSAPRATGKTRWCKDADEYARALYAFFRACDKARMRRIYCLAVPERGVGRALMDRIRRAAAR